MVEDILSSIQLVIRNYKKDGKKYQLIEVIAKKER